VLKLTQRSQEEKGNVDFGVFSQNLRIFAFFLTFEKPSVIVSPDSSGILLFSFKIKDIANSRRSRLFEIEKFLLLENKRQKKTPVLQLMFFVIV
jgi:hypothetical protein